MGQYTEDSISQALQAIANGQSVQKAALQWGIPRTTIRNRIRGRESRKEAFSGLQRLSPVQEQRLTSWILTQGELGLPPTHAQIRQFVQRILAVKGDHQPLGKHWMQAFLKRNPTIQTQKAYSRESARVNGASTEVIRPWFNHLSLPEVQAIKPENRYNMDEAGIMEGLGENGLVIGSAGKRSIQKKFPGSRVWTTFIECVSASGVALPPLVIFKGKSVQQQWFPEDLQPFYTWEFTASANGWTSDEIAVEWLEKLFIPLAIPSDSREKRLLILDGHGSHETTDFMYLCFQHNIYLLYLPPHTSHVLQPLDLSIFSALKHYYRKQIGYLNLLTDSSPIGKQNFLLCYQKARKDALSVSNIKSGWKASGLWPVSSAKPLMSRLLLENSNQTQDNTSEAQNTPISTSRWLEDSSQVVWSTPRKSKELRDQIHQFTRLDSDNSTHKLLFRKITKAFDEKDHLLATSERQNQALERELEALRPRKRRRVRTSPNSKFVNIEAIKQAQEEANGAEIEENDEEGSDVSIINSDCIVVQIGD
jgi:DDE superfamily endonuclease/helix-turn-helix, Psq domain/Tc5 transposase DNA-binding domain